MNKFHYYVTFIAGQEINAMEVAAETPVKTIGDVRAMAQAIQQMRMRAMTGILPIGQQLPPVIILSWTQMEPPNAIVTPGSRIHGN